MPGAGGSECQWAVYILYDPGAVMNPLGHKRLATCCMHTVTPPLVAVLFIHPSHTLLLLLLLQGRHVGSHDSMKLEAV
jgi:hypothetical protein